MEEWGKIAVALIGLLGSASIWRYFEKKVVTGAWRQKLNFENSDAMQFRKELQNRVKTLEEKLVQTEEENRILRSKILELSVKFQETSIRWEFINKENVELREKMVRYERENELLKKHI